ncbi:A24 family peptidase [Stenotrophomonas sp.]|uniref:A24 family peptidase n=1 Tax=Stenotrophomonas sp. TaxID=69392 RepID=UPI002D4A8291|nr:A24 family peptidase [Stenotrophomonas sp.]HYQ21847.1 A24 family peptidase [Stenotrophomonas sp.]
MTVLGLLAIGVCLRIAISDLYARRVPNTWLLAACVLAVPLLLAGQFQAPPLPWPAHLLGLLIGLAALLPFHVIGWMGAGDVKFFAVLGLLLGWHALLPVWVIASLAAGVHAVVALGSRQLTTLLPMRLQLQVNRASAHWQAHPAARGVQAARQGRHGIPYAAYLAVAAIGWVLVTTHGGTA